MRAGEPKTRRRRSNGSPKAAKRNKPRLIMAPQTAAIDKPAEKAEQEEAPETAEKERLKER